MHPASTIFSLYCYCRPCRYNGIISETIFIPIINILLFSQGPQNGHHHNHGILVASLSLAIYLILVCWTVSLLGLTTKVLSTLILSARDRLTSQLVSTHLIIVLLMNFIHASTCPLFWSFYVNNTSWCVFNFFQNSWNLSEIKLVPALEIILWGPIFWKYYFVAFY